MLRRSFVLMLLSAAALTHAFVSRARVVGRGPAPLDAKTKKKGKKKQKAPKTSGA